MKVCLLFTISLFALTHGCIMCVGFQHNVGRYKDDHWKDGQKVGSVEVGSCAGFERATKRGTTIGP